MRRCRRMQGVGRVRAGKREIVPGTLLFFWQNDSLDALREAGTVSGAERHGLHYRFAGFELEPCERRLLAHGEAVTLMPEVCDTFVSAANLGLGAIRAVPARDATIGAMPWPS